LVQMADHMSSMLGFDRVKNRMGDSPDRGLCVVILITDRRRLAWPPFRLRLGDRARSSGTPLADNVGIELVGMTIGISAIGGMRNIVIQRSLIHMAIGHRTLIPLNQSHLIFQLKRQMIQARWSTSTRC